jgi:hypothetical protein
MSKIPKRARRKGLYRLQPPAIRSPGGDQYKIGLIDRFYIGRAHQYIRTKEKCIGGPGRYKIGKGDRCPVLYWWPRGDVIAGGCNQYNPFCRGAFNFVFMFLTHLFHNLFFIPIMGF